MENEIFDWFYPGKRKVHVYTEHHPQVGGALFEGWAFDPLTALSPRLGRIPRAQKCRPSQVQTKLVRTKQKGLTCAFV